VATAPAWVASVTTPPDDRVERQNHRDGVAYRLVDRQWRIDRGQQSRYGHYVSKALHTSGVAETSQIAIDFDPSHESLVLHQVVIHRDGRVFDRLDRSQISLIQREKDLEHQIYNGSKTLNIFIEDVRAGDAVKYSFTIEGSNPVFNGHFATRLQMRWQVPVGRVHYRVL
jgi:hypothetical protein